MTLKEKLRNSIIGITYYAIAPLMGSLSPKVREKIYWNATGKEKLDQTTYDICVHAFPFWSSIIIASPVIYGGLAKIVSNLTEGNNYAVGGILLYGFFETCGRTIKNLEEAKMGGLWDARKGTPANLPGKIIGDSIDAVVSYLRRK